MTTKTFSVVTSIAALNITAAVLSIVGITITGLTQTRRYCCYWL